MTAALHRRLKALEATQSPPAVPRPDKIRLVAVHPDGREEVAGVIVVDWARRGAISKGAASERYSSSPEGA